MVRGRRGRRSLTPEVATTSDASNSEGATGGQQLPLPQVPVVTVPTVVDETVPTVESRLATQDKLLATQNEKLGRMEEMLEKLTQGKRSRSSRRKHQSSPRRHARSRSRRPGSSSRSRLSRSRRRSSSRESVSSMSDGSRSPSPKKSKPFSQENFLARHEKLNTFDRLMLCNIRTVNICIEQGTDAQAVLDHMERLCVKAANKVYQVEALIAYDKAVRARANLKGLSAFKTVETADILTYFCYDNTEIAKQASNKSKKPAARSDQVRSCFAYNKVSGCNSQNCRYKHHCMFCKSNSHGSFECKTESKSTSK